MVAVDCSTWTPLAYIPAGQGPHALVHDSVAHRVYCTCAAGDSVTVIDCDSSSATASLGLDYWPVQTVWSPAWRRVYVASHYGSSIAVIRDSLGGGVERRDRPFAPRPTPNATIVRSVIVLPESPVPSRQSHSCLLDITGRKALSLRPGANDVRRLPAGVYFVRAGESGATAKVVVQR
ncbi:hypothetical protein FJY71_05355 [candidate division WOR-3 bacterium]|nr:hypothetical protein [candidate division WOR-3 bacterium]